MAHASGKHSMSTERRLVAIVFTDMVGYTARVQRDEALARRQLEAQRRTVRAALPQFAGREIEVIGDAFLLEFRSALRALQFAVAIQKRLAETSNDERILLRIGLHVGDLERLGKGVFGDSVNIASRIQSTAPEGGLAMSAQFFEQVRNQFPAPFRALGPTTLKGIERQIELHVLDADALMALPMPSPLRVSRSRKGWIAASAAVLVGLAAAVYLLKPATPSVAPTAAPSVAVLPFSNLSADADNAYFADGVHDAILTHLARVPGLKVTSRTSVMPYRDVDDANLRDIARTLGVANIVEGTVQRADRRARISAQLIEAASDRLLWADTYDRDLADIFSIQSDVAKRIGSSVHAELSPAVIRDIERAPTTDTGAYDLYLRAMDIEHTQPVDSADRYYRTQSLLERAVATDPSFALAHAALASAHITTYWWAFDLTHARLEQARVAAQTALDLDPASAEAHLAYGTYFYYGYRDYERALAEYEIALSRQPNNADILAFIGFVKRRQGRWQESLNELDRAMELDPQNPTYVRNQAESLWNVRRYADAERVLADWLVAHPDDVSIRRYRAYLIKDWKGDLDFVEQALASIPASVDLDHRVRLDRIQLAAAQGRTQDALQQLIACDCPWINFPGASRYPKDVALGDLHAALGDGAAARAAYGRAVALLETDLQQRPDDARARAHLGIAYAGLGEFERGLSQSRQAMKEIPPERDALVGPLIRELYARALLMSGDVDGALGELEALARSPGASTPYTWRFNPVWREIHAHPRFQRMLAAHDGAAK